jgi:hypothetical protein
MNGKNRFTWITGYAAVALFTAASSFAAVQDNPLQPTYKRDSNVADTVMLAAPATGTYVDAQNPLNPSYRWASDQAAATWQATAATQASGSEYKDTANALHPSYAHR